MTEQMVARNTKPANTHTVALFTYMVLCAYHIFLFFFFSFRVTNLKTKYIMSKINLFRGQKHDTKEWVYGDLLHIAGGCIIYHGSQTECTGNPSVGAVLELFSNEISVVIPKTVSQFSGIKDIKGNNIFEGDILKVGENLTCEIFYVENNNEDYGDEIHSSFHAKIKQHNKIIPLDSYLKNNCIIVGNIFDNQDLVSF